MEESARFMVETFWNSEGISEISDNRLLRADFAQVTFDFPELTLREI
jgi:hypothetical protein